MLVKKERREAKKSYSPEVLNSKLGLINNSAACGVANWLYQK